jgi:hypothetical protein
VKTSNLIKQFPLPHPDFLDVTSWALLHQSEVDKLLMGNVLRLFMDAPY